MSSTDALPYQHGFGNVFASEAVEGALPREHNNPQHAPFGLTTEQLNGTGFTVVRAHNRRTWMYRLRPTVGDQPWELVDQGRFVGDYREGTVSPELLRFGPQPYPEGAVDFLAGIETFAGAGDPTQRTGFAIHRYAATASMGRVAFANVDAELLAIPQEGRLRVQTELGWLEAGPGELLILPRGLRFRVELPDGRARGYLGELPSGHYQLPERGPVGANGLADARHFRAPVAAFEDSRGAFAVVHRAGGQHWRTTLPHSPFDVVAWHGSYAPFVYDLRRFSSMWNVNFDHPDPSILTVLTCPWDTHGRNAVDVAVFRGRWDPTEHTFRPPWFHRNSAVEFNAVIQSPATGGPYQAGAVTYTPYLSPHGISAQGVRRELARTDDAPRRGSDEELWVQLESTFPLRVMPWTTAAPYRDHSYLDQFEGYPEAELP